MDFFNQTGKMAIGSRLRMLTDKITEDAGELYKLYDVELQPKWFPVFHVLSQSDNTIMEIAQQIKHSHPSVSKIVAEMSKKGIVIEKKDRNDGRRNIVSLSKKGKSMSVKIQGQYTDVNVAVEEILSVTRNNLWAAIEEWEYVLEQKSLLQRVREQKKRRESKDVRIVEYKAEYAEAFRQLNVVWISKYFKMEAADYKSLDHPKAYILDKGGKIMIALYGDEPVGACALLKMDDPKYEYELAKMAVSSKAQGKGVGWLLGLAIIEQAKLLGAKTLYLESNTILGPAISLYQKLGFRKVAGHATPYERCNIQMELELDTVLNSPVKS